MFHPLHERVTVSASKNLIIINKESRKILQLLYETGRHTAYYSAGFHILSNYSTGSYHCIVAYSHPLQNSGVGTYPYILAENYRCRIGYASLLRLQSMVESCKHYVMTYLAAVAESYSPVVLKMAAGIYENIFSHMDILSEIRMERRKHTQGFGHSISEKFGQQSSNFIRCVIR